MVVMTTKELALVRGWADTRESLSDWRRRPVATVGPWAAGSLAVAVLLLLATWIVAMLSLPDSDGFLLVGVGRVGQWDDFFFILYRNALVLALHAMACVAGFIAGSSLRHAAEGYSGWVRWMHDKAGPAAIAFVVGATAFSLLTQAYALGGAASTMAAQLGVSPAVLMIGLLPHALPELFALFLPLAAWTVASRRGDWHHLLAATFVTVAIAVPTLLVSAAVEVWVTSHVLLAIAA
jgi:hypothetical protein